MSAEDEHVAHPRLFGAPAYARPPLSVTSTQLPLDPDDLPIEAEQTAHERAIAALLSSKPYRVAEAPVSAAPEPRPQLQPLRLGALAGKFLRRAS